MGPMNSNQSILNDNNFKPANGLQQNFVDDKLSEVDFSIWSFNIPELLVKI